MEINNKNIHGGILPETLTEMQGVKSPLVYKTLCNKKITAELGGDYTVPEYMPAIRKLIRVDVETSSPSELMTSGGVRLDGTLEYRALYTGADGKIYCVSFPAEYSFLLPFGPDCDVTSPDSAKVLAEVVPESVVSRVSGSGKINIRARLAANVKVKEKTDLGLYKDFSEPHLRKLIKKAEVWDEKWGYNEDITLSCKPEINKKERRFVTGNGNVFVEEAVCGDGYVSCKGNAVVSVLMCGEGERDDLHCITLKLPFSETLSVDGAIPGATCTVKGICRDIRAVSDGLDEESGEMMLTLELRLDGTAYVPETVSYVKDIYSTEYESECEREIHGFPILLCGRNGNMTFSGTLAAKDIFGGEITEIIEVLGSAEPEEVISEGEKYTLSGKCHFDVIYRSEEDGELLSADAELPFKYEIRGREGEIRAHNFSIQTIDPHAKFDGDNISFDCELAISGAVMGETVVEAVSGISLGAAVEKRKGGFTVCYPDGDEDLWSLAKRYRVSAEHIARENGMACNGGFDECSVAEGTGFVII